MLVSPGIPRVLAPQSAPVFTGNAAPLHLVSHLLPTRPASSMPLESGGDGEVPLLDYQPAVAEPEAEEPPPSGPGRDMPPAEPGAPPPTDDGPGPGCGAAWLGTRGWLAALAPAATALWERMDASPWALCSLAVPAGLALVVGSCATDPSDWQQEPDEPRSPSWREWRRMAA
jgi:hypothetical protein